MTKTDDMGMPLTAVPICPHCGRTQPAERLDIEYADWHWQDMECLDCGRTYRLRLHCAPQYSTKV